MNATTSRLALHVQLASFPGLTLEPEMEQILSEGLGGVCLFDSNTSAGMDAVAELTKHIRASNPAVVIAIDEEGGDVTRLHTHTGSTVLGAAALGAIDDPVVTRYVGAQVGAELASVGINLNLGPVVDVNTNPDNPVIGTRSFGTDPELVARHTRAWIEGLHSAGVAACVKHFPGHGDTSHDSHHDLGVVDVDLKTLSRRELIPFAAAVTARTSAVMTAHLLVPALDPDLPVTLSSRCLGYLRSELGFDGLVVTDALDMDGVCGADRGVAEAAVQSLIAGADLLCLGTDKPQVMIREVQDAIVSAVESGRLSRSRLEGAAQQVAALGRVPHADPVLGVPPSHRAESLDLVDVARQSFVVRGDLPSLHGADVVTLTTIDSPALGDAAWGLSADLRIDPARASPEPLIRTDGTPLLVQVRDAHRHRETRRFVQRLVASGATVVMLEWGWPGVQWVDVPTIWTLGSSRVAVAALTALLREAGWDR